MMGQWRQDGHGRLGGHRWVDRSGWESSVGVGPRRDGVGHGVLQLLPGCGGPLSSWSKMVGVAMLPLLLPCGAHTAWKVGRIDESATMWEVRTGCRTSVEVGAALRRGGGDRVGRRLSHDTAHVSESLLGSPQDPVRSHTNYTRCYSTVQ